jgi:CRP/FNR family cyclic AMP-dependent transcriptional regulator
MSSIHPAVRPGSAALAVIREFQHFSHDDLEAVAAKCRWRRYAAQAVVVRYLDASDDIFFVVDGAVRLTYYSAEGREVILGDLSAGEMFGELAAIDGRRRSATAVAKTDALLASMSAPDFLLLAHSCQEMSMAILKRLTEQVRRLTERVFDFSTLAVRHRLHAELLRLATGGESLADNQVLIAPAPTHVEIANRISTHREAVTRELNELARSRLVRRDGPGLVILDMAALRQMVHEVRGAPA